MSKRQDAIHGVNVSATGMEPHRYRPRQPVQPTPATAHNRAPVPVGMTEQQSNVYEKILAPNTAGKVGPTRFEEGLGADPAVPANFVGGIAHGYIADEGERGKRSTNVRQPMDAERSAGRLHRRHGTRFVATSWRTSRSAAATRARWMPSRPSASPRSGWAPT
jgi:hypothetical protein